MYHILKLKESYPACNVARIFDTRRIRLETEVQNRNLIFSSTVGRMLSEKSDRKNENAFVCVCVSVKDKIYLHY